MIYWEGEPQRVSSSVLRRNITELSRRQGLWIISWMRSLPGWGFLGFQVHSWGFLLCKAELWRCFVWPLGLLECSVCGPWWLEGLSVRAWPIACLKELIFLPFCLLLINKWSGQERFVRFSLDYFLINGGTLLRPVTCMNNNWNRAWGLRKKEKEDRIGRILSEYCSSLEFISQSPLISKQRGKTKDFFTMVQGTKKCNHLLN